MQPLAIRMIAVSTAGCLVIDQHMPETNGLEVVNHLQQEGIGLLTILIADRLGTNTREHAASLGVTKIVDKPSPPIIWGSYPADLAAHLPRAMNQ